MRSFATLSLVVLLAPAGAWAEDYAAPVETAPIVADEIADGRTFVGNVVASRHSVVGSEFEGFVEEFLVREGDYVGDKQPLAQLRTKVIDRRIEAARAELTLRTSAHQELKNGSRPEEIQASRARLDQATSDIELRKWKLEAAQRLYESRTISKDELRDAQLALQAATDRKKEAAATLALVEAGPRAERIAQAAARVAAQQAEVDRLVEEKERYTIRAPFPGHVVREHTEVGQWLSAGSPVAALSALKEVDVVVPVLEDFVAGLREGTAVAVMVGAIPDRIFDGTIHRIVPKANDRARTFPVKIRVTNEVEGKSVLLKEGMFARVSLAVGKKVEALLVPKDALVLGGPSPMVYAVDPETSTVMAVPVQLGIARNGEIQVRGALQAGMRVVTRGNERLRPGQKVVDASAPRGER